MTMKDRIESLRTPRGGWTKKTLTGLGVPWPPPRGWKKALERGAVETLPFNGLLEGSEALTKPNYRLLNESTARNDRTLHALLCAYAKHHMGCDAIGWERLSEIMHSAICEAIGDDAYCAWSDKMVAERDGAK